MLLKSGKKSFIFSFSLLSSFLFSEGVLCHWWLAATQFLVRFRLEPFFFPFLWGELLKKLIYLTSFWQDQVYELGWNWDEYELLAQGSLSGHLLECGCQLTGGYYMHPGDFSFQLYLPLYRLC